MISGDDLLEYAIIIVVIEAFIIMNIGLFVAALELIGVI